MAQWGCYGTGVMDAAQRTASLEIGQGRANTMKITAKICIGDDDSVSAASIAKAYNGGSKTDWFLPSRKELDALCNEFFTGRSGEANPVDNCMGSGNTKSVTSATNATPVWSFAAGLYWSSSESYINGAWAQSFSPGGQDSFTKGLATLYVRPVRAF